MKTILFVCLFAPLSAFATPSYSCQGESGTLTIAGPDDAHITALFNQTELKGAVTKSSGSIFKSIDYALASDDGVTAALKVTIMPSMTRGGSFCGRGACDPSEPVQSMAHISASLVIGSDAPFEFTCYETAHESLD